MTTGGLTSLGTAAVPVEYSKSSRKGEHWTPEEHDAFLLGLKELGRGSWRSISDKYVPSRTPAQVASHSQKYFLKLEGLTKKRTAGVSLVTQVSNQDDRQQRIAVSPANSACGGSADGKSTTTVCHTARHDTASTHGEHWTEDEHAAFLQGLDELGKGAWRAISERFVPTRSPTQVASHSQKYFLKLEGGARKRKSSGAQHLEPAAKQLQTCQRASLSADPVSWALMPPEAAVQPSGPAPPVELPILPLNSISLPSAPVVGPCVTQLGSTLNGVQLSSSLLPLLQQLARGPQLCGQLPTPCGTVPCSVPVACPVANTLVKATPQPQTTPVPSQQQTSCAVSRRSSTSSGGVLRPQPERASEDLLARLWGSDPDAAAAMVLGALKNPSKSFAHCIPIQSSAQSAFRSPVLLGI